MTFQLPDIEVATEEPEPAVVYHHDISSRPSFNRTPIGWGGSGEPGSIHMEFTIPFDGETDDLWTYNPNKTKQNKKDIFIYTCPNHPAL